MGYDEWLEEPYQQACKAQEDWERAEENFLDDDAHLEAFDEWLETEGNAGKSLEEWQQTGDYQKSVDCYLEMMNSRYDNY